MDFVAPVLGAVVTNNGNHSAARWAALCVNAIVTRATGEESTIDGVPQVVIRRDRMAFQIAHYIRETCKAEKVGPLHPNSITARAKKCVEAVISHAFQVQQRGVVITDDLVVPIVQRTLTDAVEAAMKRES